MKLDDDDLNHSVTVPEGGGDGMLVTTGGR
jgi:hypothetical protein